MVVPDSAGASARVTSAPTMGSPVSVSVTVPTTRPPRIGEQSAA
jgi:hypothetical protein